MGEIRNISSSKKSSVLTKQISNSNGLAKRNCHSHFPHQWNKIQDTRLRRDLWLLEGSVHGWLALRQRGVMKESSEEKLLTTC